MGMKRPLGHGPVRIQLPVACPQPAQGDRAILEEGIKGETDLLTTLVELLQGNEDVGIVAAFSLKPESKAGMTGQLGVLLEAEVECCPPLRCILP